VAVVVVFIIRILPVLVEMVVEVLGVQMAVLPQQELQILVAVVVVHVLVLVLLVGLV
jgi:hypothetical protein